MNIIKWLMIGSFYLLPVVCLSQDISIFNSDTKFLKGKQIYGFIRGGLYAGFDHEDADKPYVSSAFSDLGLKIEMENGINFKAFADIRFRYGAEFLDPVHNFDIREAYVKVNGKRWNLTTGQTIVKWGRADFTNPTSKINPQNFIYRSPDREDMDMGNLLSVFNWYPTERFNLEAVAMPFYRSSVLIIDPIPLPENVTINQINTLLTGKEWFTYGLKADMHLQGIDWSLSWFDGYDPMPGTALTEFNLDLSGPIPVPYTELTITPYKNRVLGIDFETYAGNIGIRGEAAWLVPYKSYTIAEYVPWPEIKWVAGLDWSSGIWRIIGEYSGKMILEFTPALVDPVIGTEPDYAKIAELLAIPDFDLESYVREQVQAFNRLYNYQLEEYYHSAGLRIETELLYGKLTPSLFSLYNFTSRDLLVIPEIKYKPADGLTITAGAEVYSGRSGSLYDIVNEFMTSIYFAIRVDF
jgi:hypothetical protein